MLASSNNSSSRVAEIVRPGEAPSELSAWTVPIVTIGSTFWYRGRQYASLQEIRSVISGETRRAVIVVHENEAFVTMHHQFKDRGDGQCETCAGPLLVGRSTPHEAAAPTEAKP
jgi:hypothetical protein